MAVKGKTLGYLLGAIAAASYGLNPDSVCCSAHGRRRIKGKRNHEAPDPLQAHVPETEMALNSGMTASPAGVISPWSISLGLVISIENCNS